LDGSQEAPNGFPGKPLKHNEIGPPNPAPMEGTRDVRPPRQPSQCPICYFGRHRHDGMFAGAREETLNHASLLIPRGGHENCVSLRYLVGRGIVPVPLKA